MMISHVSLLVPYTEALKSVRTSLGLSQKAFAERIGIVPSYYYKIEEGNRRPSRKVYQKIYAALETTSLYIPFQVNHLYGQTEPVPRRMRATLAETEPVLFDTNYQATAC